MKLASVLMEILAAAGVRYLFGTRVNRPRLVDATIARPSSGEDP